MPKKKKTSSTSAPSSGTPINVRCPSTLYAQLEYISHMLNVDISNLVRLILSENIHPYIEKAHALEESIKKYEAMGLVEVVDVEMRPPAYNPHDRAVGQRERRIEFSEKGPPKAEIEEPSLTDEDLDRLLGPPEKPLKSRTAQGVRNNEE